MDRRAYNQFCALATALDRIGERWTLLVIRELLVGPKRYSDLREGLPGIAANLLAQRLRTLEADGLIRKRRLPKPAASTVYELTDLGRDLEPALLALMRWGSGFMGRPTADQVVRTSWFGLALKALAGAERAGRHRSRLRRRTGRRTDRTAAGRRRDPGRRAPVRRTRRHAPGRPARPLPHRRRGFDARRRDRRGSRRPRLTTKPALTPTRHWPTCGDSSGSRRARPSCRNAAVGSLDIPASDALLNDPERPVHVARKHAPIGPWPESAVRRTILATRHPSRAACDGRPLTDPRSRQPAPAPRKGPSTCSRPPLPSPSSRRPSTAAAASAFDGSSPGSSWPLSPASRLPAHDCSLPVSPTSTQAWLRGRRPRASPTSRSTPTHRAPSMPLSAHS